MSWGSTLVSAAGAAIAVPVLVLASLILLPAAIFSTVAAASALALRAAVIYIELFCGILTDILSGRRWRSLSFKPASTTTAMTSSGSNGQGSGNSTTRPRSVRSFASSTGSQTSTSHSAAPAQTAPIYTGANPFVRDFEGIGGWRIANAEEEDSDDQFLTMNSRLELPGVAAVAPEERTSKRSNHHHLHHQRRSTAGAVLSDRPASHSRNGSSRSRPSSALVTGRSTPTADGAYDAQGRVKSLTQLGTSTAAILDGLTPNQNHNRAPRVRRKGSTSSSGSQHTLVM